MQSGETIINFFTATGVRNPLQSLFKGEKTHSNQRTLQEFLQTLIVQVLLHVKIPTPPPPHGIYSSYTGVHKGEVKTAQKNICDESKQGVQCHIVPRFSLPKPNMFEQGSLISDNSDPKNLEYLYGLN